MIGSLVQVVAWGGLSLGSHMRDPKSLETLWMIGMLLISVFILALDLKLSKQSSDSN
jgi:hypothetical protein